MSLQKDILLKKLINTFCLPKLRVLLNIYFKIVMFYSGPVVTSKFCFLVFLTL